jgi:hypothetical protein
MTLEISPKIAIVNEDPNNAIFLLHFDVVEAKAAVLIRFYIQL